MPHAVPDGGEPRAADRLFCLRAEARVRSEGLGVEPDDGRPGLSHCRG